MSRLRQLGLGLGALCLLASCRSAGIKRAYMSLDSDGKRQRDVFYTDSDGIFCVAEVASGRDDVTIEATLRQTAEYSSLNGALIPTSHFLARSEEAPGAGDDIKVSFQLELENDDQPFPAGRFACDLALDGDREESLDFEIRFPACPAAPLVTGLACAGFVLPGATCPGAVTGTLCTCAGSGAWECA
jgi:hypothetical protein